MQCIKHRLSEARVGVVLSIPNTQEATYRAVTNLWYVQLFSDTQIDFHNNSAASSAIR